MRLKNALSLKRLIVLASCIPVSAISYAVLLKNTVSSDITLQNIVFEIRGTSSKTITAITPLNSEIPLVSIGGAVFAPAKTGCIRKIVESGGGETQAAVSYKVGNSKKWEPLTEISHTKNETVYSQAHPEKSLFKGFDGGLNYRGDKFVFALACFNALLIVLALVLLWTQRQVLQDLLQHLSQFKRLADPPALFMNVSVLTVMAILNKRNCSLLELGFRQPDELPVTESIIGSGCFFWRGLYDSLYNAAVAIFALHAGSTGDVAEAVYSSRMLSAVCGCGVVSTLSASLPNHLRHSLKVVPILSALLAIPAFWINMSIAKPDMMMTMFVTLSCVLYVKDGGNFGPFFRLASLSLGAAIGTKIHALMFLPMPYIFVLCVVHVKEWTRRLLEVSVSMLAFVALFGIEYLDVPFSLNQIFHIAAAILEDTSGFDGKYTGIAERFSVFFNCLLAAPVALCLLFSVLRIVFRATARVHQRATAAVLISLLIAACYSLLVIAKAWQNYYISFTVAASVIVLGACARSVNASVLAFVSVSMICVQLVLSYSQFHQFSRDWYLPSESYRQLQLSTWDHIKGIINSEFHGRCRVLCSGEVGFDSSEFRAPDEVSMTRFYRLPKTASARDFSQFNGYSLLVVRKWNGAGSPFSDEQERKLEVSGARVVFSNSLVCAYDLRGFSLSD